MIRVVSKVPAEMVSDRGRRRKGKENIWELLLPQVTESLYTPSFISDPNLIPQSLQHSLITECSHPHYYQQTQQFPYYPQHERLTLVISFGPMVINLKTLIPSRITVPNIFVSGIYYKKKVCLFTYLVCFITCFWFDLDFQLWLLMLFCLHFCTYWSGTHISLVRNKKKKKCTWRHVVVIHDSLIDLEAPMSTL